ncbi:MAG: N,N-dimethylformamidase beta subunit family domain-containing protein [Actinomycetota bacterium]
MPPSTVVNPSTGAPATAVPATPPPTAAPTTELVDSDHYTSPGWVAAENALPGDPTWRIDDDGSNPFRALPEGWVEGYADRTSAELGDSVTLFVDTPAATFTVRAYRMGWYDGDRARLIATSGPHPGRRQSPPVLDRVTGLAEAPWQRSTTLAIDGSWPPGAYLLRLDTDAGGAHYVPLTVRWPGVAADLTLVNAVSTWQAYNPWGGCTLYDCFNNLAKQRADIVSFDRPYSAFYGRGSADFLTHELPLIAFAEQQGIDVEYITSIDLDRDPALATAHHGVITTGHDEYYSRSMRDALVDALDEGVNLAFFGANAIYRHVRFEPGANGATDRRMVNYRSTDDPATRTDPMLATVNWREPPLQEPEAEIVGIEYGCAEARADLVLTNTAGWVYQGTDARNGQRLRRLVGVEFDELAPGDITPPGVEVFAASPVVCRQFRYQQVTVYRSTASGAGVFAAGTIDWNCGLDGTCPGIEAFSVVRGITANVLAVFASGPAGRLHPSTENAARYRVGDPTPVGGGGGSDGGGSGGGDGGTTVPPDTSAPPDTAPPPASDPTDP